jgi:hypothetical protein
MILALCREYDANAAWRRSGPRSPWTAVTYKGRLMGKGRRQVVTVVGGDDAAANDVKGQAARQLRLLLADRSRNLHKYPAGEKGGPVRVLGALPRCPAIACCISTWVGCDASTRPGISSRPQSARQGRDVGSGTRNPTSRPCRADCGRLPALGFLSPDERGPQWR